MKEEQMSAQAPPPARGSGGYLWSVHGDGRHIGPTEVVAPEERLSWPRTIGIGMQHVIAMFGAAFVVPVLTHMPPTTTIFFSGVGTLVFIAATAGRGQRLGLPSYTGSSFAFISPVIAAESHGTAAALGGIFAAGALLFIVGLLVDHFGAHVVNAVMPPVVTGAVVALIGLNLAPVAVGDVEKEGYTAFITLAAILLVTVMLRGFFGRISILLGVIVGYFVAWPFHQLHLHQNWKAADWVGRPPFHTPVHRVRHPAGSSGRDHPGRREPGPRQGRRRDDRAATSTPSSAARSSATASRPWSPAPAAAPA